MDIIKLIFDLILLVLGYKIEGNCNIERKGLFKNKIDISGSIELKRIYND